MAKECVQVKIEIGHKSVCRPEPTQEGHTHKWFVFVRGTEGSNISHFVEKVVFYLHESFPKPRRVLKEPPYKLEESGYGSFMLPIEVYFKNKDEPKKVRVEYDLFLQLVGNPPVSNVRVEAITFSDPLEDFKKRLLKAGGVVIPPPQNTVLTSPGAENPPLPLVKPEAPNQSSYPSMFPQASPPPVKKTKASPLPYVALSPLLTPKSKPKDTAGLLNGVSSNKRLSTSEDITGLAPKMKKKKPDKQADPIIKNTTSDVPTTSPPLDLDLEKMKTKTPLTGSSKKTKEPKERRRSVDAFSPTSGPKKAAPKDANTDGRLPRGKEMKDIKTGSKQDKAKKEDGKGKPDMKVQKITMKRTSEDAWSSTVRHPGMGGMLPGKKLDAMVPNMKPEESSTDDDNTQDAILRGEKEVKETLPYMKTDFGGNLQAKNTKTKRTTKKNDGVGKVNGVKRKEAKSHAKPSVNGKSSKVVPALLELHRRICSIQDGSMLQKVVDIVCGTGLFEITSSTFDFDLCTLDQETINQLQCSLSEPVS